MEGSWGRVGWPADRSRVSPDGSILSFRSPVLPSWPSMMVWHNVG
jgi:hypothetical protein